jgi:hypothetical protein
MHDDRPAAPDLRPMSLGELLDRALQLFRQLWRPLLLIGLIGIIPSVLNNLTVTARTLPIKLPFIPFLIQTRVASGSGSWVLWLGSILLGPFINGTVVMVATQAILGQSVSLRAGMQAARRRYAGLFGTSNLFGLTLVLSGIGLALFGLILPFLILPLILIAYVYFSTIWAFRSQAVLLDESPGGSEALTRSSSLVKGRFWPTAGFMLLLGLGMLVFTFGTQMLLGYALRFLPGGLVTGWLLAVANALPAAITAPVSALATTLLYYDTRMRKEGFDLAYNAALPDEPSS